jgi:type I restriction enzyme S subunit
MVEQLAKQIFPRPIEKPLHEDNVKWSSISLSEVLERGSRLEARVYDVEGRIARKTLEDCRWELTTITGKNGLAIAFHRPRFKRVFVEKSDLPIYQPSQITEIYPKPYLWISDKTKVNIDSLRVKKNQILMTCSGTIGKCTVVGETLDNCIFSHDLLRIETQNENDSGYLYAFLKSEIGQTLIQAKNYGAVISHIEPHHLDNIPIPNPQALIKIEIHNLVMDSFALRDESNRLLDEAEQLLIDELKLSPLNKLKTERFENKAEIQNFTVKLSELSERLEANYHNPNVQAILTHIEKHAEEVTTLDNANLVLRIILPSRFKRIYVGENQGVLFFGGKELLELAPRSEKFLSLKHHSKRIKSELTLDENMIMITCSGTIGKIAIVPKHWKGWTANQHILRVVPADKKIAGYIYTWLNTDYGKELITRFNYGAVVNEIDHRHIAQVQIPLLKNKDIQQKINDLVLEANQKRYNAYSLEQKAIQTINEKVIYAE